MRADGIGTLRQPDDLSDDRKFDEVLLARGCHIMLRAFDGRPKTTVDGVWGVSKDMHNFRGSLVRCGCDRERLELGMFTSSGGVRTKLVLRGWCGGVEAETERAGRNTMHTALAVI